MDKPVRITRLADGGDARGSSFTAPGPCLGFVGPVREMHAATIVPGAVRGNHYHRDTRELLLVIYADRWSLHWAEGPDGEARSEAFSGAGAVMVEISPAMPHAVRNDGAAALYIIALTNAPHDPQNPDLHRTPLV